MPKIIYCSRPTTWYLQNTRVTCPRVQKRVQKIVNFLVQKLQKPHMFDLGTHRPFMYDALWSICSIGGLWAPLQNCFTVLDPCVFIKKGRQFGLFINTLHSALFRAIISQNQKSFDTQYTISGLNCSRKLTKKGF